METPQEKAKRELIELQGMVDTETAHILADDILCQLLDDLGFEEVTEQYHKIRKWYA